MQKKLTITIDEQIYEGLHQIIGRRKISEFIERLVRPYVLNPDLEAGYRAMAEDEARERAALEWAEATMGDVIDETREVSMFALLDYTENAESFTENREKNQAGIILVVPSMLSVTPPCSLCNF